MLLGELPRERVQLIGFLDSIVMNIKQKIIVAILQIVLVLLILIDFFIIDFLSRKSNAMLFLGLTITFLFNFFLSIKKKQ